MGLWLLHAWFRIPLPTLKFNNGVWPNGKVCGNAWIDFHNMQVRILLPQQIFISHGSFRGVAQFGSATGLGPVGRRFESCYPDYRRVVSIDKTTVSKTVILGLNPSSPAILNRKLYEENAQIRLCAISNRQLC